MNSSQANNHRKAQIAVEMLFLAALVVILISGFVSLAASFLQLSVRAQNKLQAFEIAEAGIDYYRWHLSFAPQDFTDGTGHAGPYTHTYYDGNGNQIGQFVLTITPPPPGSTIVIVKKKDIRPTQWPVRRVEAFSGLEIPHVQVTSARRRLGLLFLERRGWDRGLPGRTVHRLNRLISAAVLALRGA